MTKPKIIGADESGRRFYSLALDSVKEWPAVLDLGSRHFILFLACDAEKIGVDSLYALAEQTLAQGVVYICAWGPGCEKAHDIFDEAVVSREVAAIEQGGVVPDDIMTTWHDKETLDEALHFFVNLAQPTEPYAADCTAWLAASIGMPDEAKSIRNVLAGFIGRKSQGK